MSSAFPEADRLRLRARLAASLPARWRTRFAPAPTGRLHLGHAVNAVYVWSIARAFGGAVVLRIEDHDHGRARDEYDAGIRDDLAWLGLVADNTALDLPDPVRQSTRDAAYATSLATLDTAGLVYPCRCSRKAIAAAGATSTDAELRYPATCRDAGVPPGETAARRLRLGDTSVTFDDLRHGLQVQVPQQQCGDLLLRDRHGQWTYQYAVVVDDLAHRIDLVIRGDDLLPSTGRQALLRAMLHQGAAPRTLHHPLVTHPDGTKLSKSLGDAGLHALRDAGWSAARVLGHAAWLGGLLPAPRDLPADALGALWDARP